MAICQIMIKDFLFGEGGLGEYYDLNDLIIGEDYAQAWKDEGYTEEPFWGYDLDEFISWCRRQKESFECLVNIEEEEH